MSNESSGSFESPFTQKKLQTSVIIFFNPNSDTEHEGRGGGPENTKNED